VLLVSPQDVERWWSVARTVDNPTGLAGRLVGMDDTEQSAGVPTWAWVTLGVAVGAMLGASAFAGPLQRLLKKR
jgi:hypothetical protein